jgi:ribosomal-protein-alanine N-acetyltransferase
MTGKPEEPASPPETPNIRPLKIRAMKIRTLKIRALTAADVNVVLALSATVQNAPHWPRTAYIAALAATSTPRRIALVAVSAQPEQLLGFAIASLLPLQAELESIVVATTTQRQGLGRRLFQELARQLRAAGTRELLLEARASNKAALAFYRSLGFTQTGLRPRYYADPIEDAVQMRLDLA